MRLGLNVGYWGLGLSASDQLELVQEAETAGFDSVWAAEAYGSDAATVLAWLAAYSATKFGVVGLSQALHKELSRDGVQVTALCPGFVATPMTDWVEGQVPKDEMIQPEDIAEGIRFLLRTSRNCVIPELQFVRPGDSEL